MNSGLRLGLQDTGKSTVPAARKSPGSAALESVALRGVRLPSRSPRRTTRWRVFMAQGTPLTQRRQVRKVGEASVAPIGCALRKLDPSMPRKGGPTYIYIRKTTLPSRLPSLARATASVNSPNE